MLQYVSFINFFFTSENKKTNIMKNTQWDKTYDVVVVGSGAGALTAALTAIHQGLRVVILEKTA
ncbi:hypothetical protein JCM31826_19990 [Thermaurantimonas aggregans]|uniref:FAD-dependent oxidoreductase 2 FAD-binding domain-containing protein n=1 Tax=Thermaurantimonas aggregans TaxID=2173829 RepID=A0A401XNB8_9FLAO|nr:hypothetical protein JCM31826_19990 [Thermaurantimonas aggregans]